MKAYIAINYKNRKKLIKELIAINMALNSSNVESLVFVDHYSFEEINDKKMMEVTMKEIDSCSFLIAEGTYKGSGIGVEVGYAKAKRKPIIYTRHIDSEHSTSIAGMCDFQIIYSNPKDLFDRLNEFLSKAL